METVHVDPDTSPQDSIVGPPQDDGRVSCTVNTLYKRTTISHSMKQIKGPIGQHSRDFLKLKI